MAGSTTNLPARPTRRTRQGHDIRALGPSDSSDTGADLTDQGALDDTSDHDPTGERINAGDERVRSDHDIDTDRVVGPEEADLDSGLDEAEEAWQAWLEHDRGEH